MSFPKYPKYKDSGVEWLGEVPEHWEVKRLKRCVRLVTAKAEERSNPVALEHIEGWTGRLIPSEGDYQGEGTAFAAGDILFGKLRPYLAKIHLASQPGEAVGDFHVLRPSKGFDGHFAQYHMLTREFIDMVDGSTYGSKMPRASWEFVGGMPMAVPPPVEQPAIATFLDRETAKIDALIAEQQRLLELLQEKRQAVISHAVTKGLNPDVPMKGSGIDWLGEVPEHWDVKMLKYLSPQVTVGIVVEPSKHYVTEGVPALRSLNVTGDGVVMENVVFISPEANELHRKSRLHAGDIVAVRSGQPGTCAIIPPDLDGCNCVDLIIIRKPEACTSQFLRWYLSSDFAKVQFGSGAEGAIQQHFNVSTASRLLVAVPPLSEQDAIVAFVDDATHTLDTLRDEAQLAVSLLQERRSALISAAVTGQIDVRGLAGSEAA